jgi:hypothetical protein
MNYKDPQNNLHDIEPNFAHLLPEGCIQITQEEADAIVASKVVPPTYQELRRAAYPPASDYLDGVVKGDQAQIDKYIADCLAVKAKYPKG